MVAVSTWTVVLIVSCWFVGLMGFFLGAMKVWITLNERERND